MSKLSELRNRSRETKELQEQKIARVRDVVRDVVNSTSFGLSAVNNLAGEASEEEINNFANNVANKVAAEITNPINDFLDVCKSRGVPDRKIERTVIAICDLFNLTDSTVYEDKLEAVALYLQKNPSLYEDIALLA